MGKATTGNTNYHDANTSVPLFSPQASGFTTKRHGQRQLVKRLQHFEIRSGSIFPDGINSPFQHTKFARKDFRRAAARPTLTISATRGLENCFSPNTSCEAALAGNLPRFRAPSK
ncbi:hypothetical protein EVG20_g5256 [Dentipellis fragilis]|uniref:Uncharacterized protein n=1 Tax=Dentipellis fragilis TaxID=205917 RepID=A0A4Y9YTS6_9AGAM|nr:hypothetical protein EVG20_g5256 [Dentipellis fragilis]